MLKIAFVIRICCSIFTFWLLEKKDNLQNKNNCNESNQNI